MNQATPQDLAPLAQSLCRLHPPRGLVHVGSGFGLGAMHLWHPWPVDHVLLVEAAATSQPWSESLLAAHPGWQKVEALLAGEDGELDYFQASNPAESGLLDPAQLTPIWTGLRTVEAQRRRASRLDGIFQELGLDWRPDWLLIDCFPALPILEGARGILDDCSLIWVRVVLDDAFPGLAGARLSEIDAYLGSLTFARIGYSEGRHPAVGEALFVRNWHAHLAPHIAALVSARNAKARVVKERQTQLDQLTAAQAAWTREKAELVSARDAQTQLVQERQTQLDQLTAAQAAWTREKAELVSARDVQTQLVQERQTDLDQLTAAQAAWIREKAELVSARDAQTQLVQERQTQLDQLTAAQAAWTREKAELISARDAQAKRAAECQQQLEALKKTRDEQAKLDESRQAEIGRLTQSREEARARVMKLESELAETEVRQRLLSEEMIRAEGQIDLIKDVLLRETGL